MIKRIFVASALLLAFLLSSCTFPDFSDTTGSLTYTFDSSMVQQISATASASSARAKGLRAAEDDQETTKFTMELILSGGYSASKTVEIKDGSSIKFTDIPEGTELSAEGNIYIEQKSEEAAEDTEVLKILLYTGKTETFIIKAGKNQVDLELKKVQTENENTDTPDIPSEPDTPASEKILITYELNGGSWAESAIPPDNITNETQITLADFCQVSKAGYDFEGWYRASDFAEDKKVTELNRELYILLQNESAALTLYAKWAPASVKYTVRHLIQNLEDEQYTAADSDTQTLEGTTDSLTAAAAKTYAGFTAKTVTQKTIAADGTTVVDIYYDRNTYSLTYVNTKAEISITEPEKTLYKYGEKVELYYPSILLYDLWLFAGWTDNASLYYTIGGETSFAMPAADLTLYSIWTSDNGDAEISVSFVNEEFDDIEVTKTVESGRVKFAVTGSYTKYTWKLDGQEKGSASTFEILLADLTPGIYEVTLFAENSDGPETEYYSYSVQISTSD